MAKKSSNKQSERLFEEKLVPAKPGSGELFDVSYDEEPKPVECLGMTFPNDKARRAHFTEKLREKLKDPSFRKLEGFPIGEDDDILALSDPPYYTACPNPFLNDFLSDKQESSQPFCQTPFAADVSESKSDPLYNAHSYHTKVPPRAVARYILWFTQPGDVILDSYCGSGMTGVAADMCASPPEDFKSSLADEFRQMGRKSVLWGERLCILNDLSPAATFIASNFAHPRNINAVTDELTQALESAKKRFGTTYETAHSGWPAGERNPSRWKNKQPIAGKNGNVVFVIWTEVLTCPDCGEEVNLWLHGLDPAKAAVKEKITCPNCGAASKKLEMNRREESTWDEMLGATVTKNKFVPAFIIYDVDGKRYEKVPDENDLKLAAELDSSKYRSPLPAVRMMHNEGAWGNMHRAGYHRGISHVHHFFTKRNWLILADLWASTSLPGSRFVLTSLMNRLSRMSSLHMKNFFNGGGGFAAGNTKGNLYFPSFYIEQSPFEYLPERTKRASAAFRVRNKNPNTLVSAGSASSLQLKNNSVDYVFIDPPFGQNLIYSELNFMWESFLRVCTNVQSEAIVDNFRSKDIMHYQQAMRHGFEELYRVLKPGRWMTVEFHNSQNAVWMAIQEAIISVGFVIADVRVLDKQQGSHKQNVSLGAVKKDLVICAYKPKQEAEQLFGLSAGTEKGMWTFLDSHLSQLPEFVGTDNKAAIIAERFNYMLFDRMVAFHVQHGVTVPMSAAEFYAGLRQRYPERDGMYFLPDQVNEYDRRRLSVSEVQQLELFVSDEKTAIQWVRKQLSESPMAYRELQPVYMQEAQRVWDKHEQPIELHMLLEQNFVEDDKGRWCVPDPKSEIHIEQLRHKSLLKEFQQYIEAKGKLKVVRSEALRAGFKECWQKKDYTTIVQMAKRVPDAVIQEDPALLMYFDNASLLKGE